MAGSIDYKAPLSGGKSVADQLDLLCPDGIDFYFDTVGGEILDEVRFAEQRLTRRTGTRLDRIH